MRFKSPYAMAALLATTMMVSPSFVTRVAYAQAAHNHATDHGQAQDSGSAAADAGAGAGHDSGGDAGHAAGAHDPATLAAEDTPTGEEVSATVAGLVDGVQNFDPANKDSLVEGVKGLEHTTHVLQSKFQVSTGGDDTQPVTGGGGADHADHSGGGGSASGGHADHSAGASDHSDHGDSGGDTAASSDHSNHGIGGDHADHSGATASADGGGHADHSGSSGAGSAPAAEHNHATDHGGGGSGASTDHADHGAGGAGDHGAAASTCVGRAATVPETQTICAAAVDHGVGSDSSCDGFRPGESGGQISHCQEGSGHAAGAHDPAALASEQTPSGTEVTSKVNEVVDGLNNFSQDKVAGLVDALKGFEHTIHVLQSKILVATGQDSTGGVSGGGSSHTASSADQHASADVSAPAHNHATDH